MNNYIEFNGKKWALDKLKVQKRLRTSGVTVKNFRIYADDHGKDKNIMIGAIYSPSPHGVNSEHQWRHVEFGVPGSYNSPFKEYRIWDHILKDTPIWVRSSENDCWLPRHFSGQVNEYGDPLMFEKGLTSFTNSSGKLECWNYYKLNEKVESIKNIKK